MGYNVHITRKSTSWADENDPGAISLAEWEAYVADDAELELDNQMIADEALDNPTAPRANPRRPPRPPRPAPVATATAR